MDESVNYTIREDRGSVNITILFDQPSCHPITITANPRERSILSARGMYIHDMNNYTRCTDYDCYVLSR